MPIHKRRSMKNFNVAIEKGIPLPAIRGAVEALKKVFVAGA
jgi:hypothetical protein